MAADLHDLRVTGLGPGSIHRDAVRFELALGGPATPAGLPQTWRDFRLGVASGEVTADITATARDGGGNDLTATARVPVTLRDRTHEAEGRLTARWEDSGAAIERLRVALQPVEGAEKAGLIALEARGRYDRDQGELVLTPLPNGRGSEAIALAPDGVHVAGIGRPGASGRRERSSARSPRCARSSRRWATWPAPGRRARPRRQPTRACNSAADSTSATCPGPVWTARTVAPRDQSGSR